MSLIDSWSDSTPELPWRPLGPYTDILGCSIRRFSMEPTSMLFEVSRAVKQGGGVTNQLSSVDMLSGKVLTSLLESLALRDMTSPPKGLMGVDG